MSHPFFAYYNVIKRKYLCLIIIFAIRCNVFLSNQQ